MRLICVIIESAHRTTYFKHTHEQLPRSLKSPSRLVARIHDEICDFVMDGISLNKVGSRRRVPTAQLGNSDEIPLSHTVGPVRTTTATTSEAAIRKPSCLVSEIDGEP